MGTQHDVCLIVAPATRPLRGCKLVLRFSPGWVWGIGRRDRQFISWRLRAVRSTALAIPDAANIC